MLKRILRLINTVKFLKAKQIFYRFYYLFRKILFKFNVLKRPELIKSSISYPLLLDKSIHIVDSYNKRDNSFTFLNLTKRFPPNNIDWNYLEFGKLWTYNLNYFDFLSQNDSIEFGDCLIRDFISKLNYNSIGLDPYPIGLRGINWIKFFTYHNIKNRDFDNSLYGQYYILLNNIEYHLLGNHLLENGFSLIFGAYYFRDEVLYNKAKEILIDELNEQILDDGGHFERSPMYHQIILFRLLDIINLVKNNSEYKDDSKLLEFLEDRASIMLGWIEQMTFKNGSIPLFYDSSNKVAPTTAQLFEYAKRLNISTKKLPLNSSGYRKFIGNRYEIAISIGDIKASYIAGHAHSDIFTFEIYLDNKPFIVDRGISTYEANRQRDIERSSFSHNVVEVNGENQNEVWGGFRVANRAKVTSFSENGNVIEATHNGYKKFGVLHTRKWIVEKDKIVIEDFLNKRTNAIARLHFHPNIQKEEIQEQISIEGYEKYYLEEYGYSCEFNTKEKALVLVIVFQKKLKTVIRLDK